MDKKIYNATIKSINDMIEAGRSIRTTEPPRLQGCIEATAAMLINLRDEFSVNQKRDIGRRMNEALDIIFRGYKPMHLATQRSAAWIALRTSLAPKARKESDEQPRMRHNGSGHENRAHV